MDNRPGRVDGGRRCNCGECARATDGTWQGHPKVAAAMNYPRVRGEPKERMEEWAGTQCTNASMADVKRRLDQLGPGSSAIVGFYKEGGGGHWFNAVNDKGTVKAIDSLNGLVETWPPSYEGVRFSEEDMRESFAIYVRPDGGIVK